MLATVGRAFARLPHELRDAPLHWMVWDYLALRDAERLDELIAERGRIRESVLTTFAMHQPSGLEKEENKLNARVRAYMRGDAEPRPRTNAEIREFARQMNERIMAGRVLGDAPKEVS